MWEQLLFLPKMGVNTLFVDSGSFLKPIGSFINEKPNSSVLGDNQLPAKKY